MEVEAAQKAWADGILRIGNTFRTESPEAAKKEAIEFVETLYGHGSKPVLVKPVNSTTKPFRTTLDGIVSSLVGGYEEFPEDKGFTNTGPKVWDSIRFENVGISVEGEQAIAMGTNYFRDSFTGNESALEYTFGYFRGPKGKILINLHFASSPYQNHSNATNTIQVSEDQIKAAQKSFGDMIVQIGKYHEKGWSYKEHTAMMVDTLFAYDFGTVLFKPSEAKEHPFRLDRSSALAYFRGGDDNYPEDTGFALKPWASVKFENHGLILQEDAAWAVGQVTFKAESDEKEGAQYTVGYFKDQEGKLRMNLLFISVPADGEVLDFGKETNEKNLTEQSIEAAQRNWCKELVEVGAEYVMQGDYRARAEQFVDNSYAYSVRPVLFKPAEARLRIFRTSREGAVSYFAGGDSQFPEDWGFALKPWKSARFSNTAVVINGKEGLTMGHVFFLDEMGVQRKAEYTMGLIRSSEGDIRINMHHTNFPNYTEIMSVARPSILQPISQQQVLEAQQSWADGIVELGKLGRQVQALEKENSLKGLVGQASPVEPNRTTLWTKTAEFANHEYAFSEGPVLMKVTEATPSTRIRLNRAGLVSWLIGNDREFPADRGFALKPWNDVSFQNKAFHIDGGKAQAMGTLYLTDDSGSERQLQFVLGYARDIDGRLRLDLFHMALPYGASYRSIWDDVQSGVGDTVKRTASAVAGAIGGAVGGAFGAITGGGVHLVIVLLIVGLVAGFVYYFGFAWGNKGPGSNSSWGQAALPSAAGGLFSSPHSSYPQAAYPGGAGGYQPSYVQSSASHYQAQASPYSSQAFSRYNA
eukprot:CAMPEP_0197668912 /NCGR_PEP_ID=MMETSP1338-20131121/70582_1 /TAXON_ID=43686 ORGANISM="Pelagodinium beii, Strain RCC1491" /NCGR_SAMPLE_ID=MMETSP1338 /ASSEMBLY_ACC=CAM_ASM_000754 /LENGTH=809 /DNA_ID=CAMNT_0043248377 /DNA_START=77 /DNA_END=2502 /DNA_ORIENTATION=-